MYTKDFEQAIKDLCVQGLEIDEVKMKANSGGRVRQVNGHTDTLIVVWDELGRAFTTPKNRRTEEFVDLGSGKAAFGKRLKRDDKFDLKF